MRSAIRVSEVCLPRCYTDRRHQAAKATNDFSVQNNFYFILFKTIQGVQTFAAGFLRLLYFERDRKG